MNKDKPINIKKTSKDKFILFLKNFLILLEVGFSKTILIKKQRYIRQKEISIVALEIGKKNAKIRKREKAHLSIKFAIFSLGILDKIIASALP